MHFFSFHRFLNVVFIEDLLALAKDPSLLFSFFASTLIHIRTLYLRRKPTLIFLYLYFFNSFYFLWLACVSNITYATINDI